MSTSQPAAEARSKLIARRGELVRLGLHNEVDGQDLRQENAARDRTAGEDIAGVLDALTERERLEVNAIDAAIGRIDGGTWGRCIDCKGKITARRLGALPEAPRCLECAAAADAKKS